jgi:uncharacterized lipoprotein
MMQLRFGLPLILSVIGLTGCNSLAWNNGTLDYQDTTTLQPLQYPEGATVRPATPLYPAPIVDELAIENAPKFENSKGNRFQLNRVVVEDNTNEIQSSKEQVIGRPQMLVDSNQNPALRIEGPATAVWQYTLATLSSLNYKVLSQSPSKYEVTVQIDGNIYLLRLLPVGNSNNLVVFNPDNSYADPQASADLLAQVYQNWPA